MNLRLPRSPKVTNGVFENSQSIAPVVFFARPPRMLRRINVPLGMGHQAEHASRFIAQPRDLSCAPLGLAG